MAFDYPGTGHWFAETDKNASRKAFLHQSFADLGIPFVNRP